jgi:hypothetical protein
MLAERHRDGEYGEYFSSYSIFYSATANIRTAYKTSSLLRHYEHFCPLVVVDNHKTYTKQLGKTKIKVGTWNALIPRPPVNEFSATAMAADVKSMKSLALDISNFSKCVTFRSSVFENLFLIAKGIVAPKMICIELIMHPSRRYQTFKYSVPLKLLNFSFLARKGQSTGSSPWLTSENGSAHSSTWTPCKNSPTSDLNTTSKLGSSSESDESALQELNGQISPPTSEEYCSDVEGKVSLLLPSSISLSERWSLYSPWDDGDGEVNFGEESKPLSSSEKSKNFANEIAIELPRSSPTKPLVTNNPILGPRINNATGPMKLNEYLYARYDPWCRISDFELLTDQYHIQLGWTYQSTGVGNCFIEHGYGPALQMPKHLINDPSKFEECDRFRPLEERLHQHILITSDPAKILTMIFFHPSREVLLLHKNDPGYTYDSTPITLGPTEPNWSTELKYRHQVHISKICPSYTFHTQAPLNIILRLHNSISNLKDDILNQIHEQYLQEDIKVLDSFRGGLVNPDTVQLPELWSSNSQDRLVAERIVEERKWLQEPVADLRADFEKQFARSGGDVQEKHLQAWEKPNGCYADSYYAFNINPERAGEFLASSDYARYLHRPLEMPEREEFFFPTGKLLFLDCPGPCRMMCYPKSRTVTVFASDPIKYWFLDQPTAESLIRGVNVAYRCELQSFTTPGSPAEVVSTVKIDQIDFNDETTACKLNKKPSIPHMSSYLLDEDLDLKPEFAEHFKIPDFITKWERDLDPHADEIGDDSLSPLGEIWDYQNAIQKEITHIPYDEEIQNGAFLPPTTPEPQAEGLPIPDRRGLSRFPDFDPALGVVEGTEEDEPYLYLSPADLESRIQKYNQRGLRIGQVRPWEIVPKLFSTIGMRNDETSAQFYDRLLDACCKGNDRKYTKWITDPEGMSEYRGDHESEIEGLAFFRQRSGDV